MGRASDFAGASRRSATYPAGSGEPTGGGTDTGAPDIGATDAEVTDTAHAAGTAPARTAPAALGDTAPFGDTGPVRPARRGRRRYAAVAGLLTVTAIGGAAAALASFDDHGSAAGRSGQRGGGPPATAPISRGDIVETESVDGKLTYARERTVSGVRSGVVTWVPPEGGIVSRGRPLLRVNDDPVILMYGSLPLYRALREGVSDGRDVRQLERNLQAMGYGGDLTVDTEFTASTARAVKEWQEDAGLPETGSVEPGQVVFQPSAVRIGEVKAEVGAPLGGGSQVLTVTGTKPIVHVDLPASQQDKAAKGATVAITMPDGRTIKGRITSVGSVAEKSSGQGQEDAEPTVDVEIRLSEKRSGRLDQAPVSVELESARTRDVLSVPVEALLGLSEGGFGVEVIEPTGATRVVAVKVGAFGGGRVEISGDGLREGMRVGVPVS